MIVSASEGVMSDTGPVKPMPALLMRIAISLSAKTLANLSKCYS